MAFMKRLFGGGAQPPADAKAETDDDQRLDVGIFAGLFVASPEAVEAWDIETGLTPASWPAVEFKRLESVKLGMLESILTGVSYADIVKDGLHNLVRSGGSEGPWVSLVRRSLIEALATIDDSRIGAAGVAWADTDEFKARPSDKPSAAGIDDLSRAIGRLVSLARVSKARGEPVFLLMGL